MLHVPDLTAAPRPAVERAPRWCAPKALFLWPEEVADDRCRVSARRCAQATVVTGCRATRSWCFGDRRGEPPLDGRLDIGQIALATTLSWLAFRGLPGVADGRPKLARW